MNQTNLSIAFLQQQAWLNQGLVGKDMDVESSHRNHTSSNPP